MVLTALAFRLAPFTLQGRRERRLPALIIDLMLQQY
jgi:hypothetical protein